MSLDLSSGSRHVWIFLDTGQSGPGQDQDGSILIQNGFFLNQFFFVLKWSEMSFYAKFVHFWYPTSSGPTPGDFFDKINSILTKKF